MELTTVAQTEQEIGLVMATDLRAGELISSWCDNKKILGYREGYNAGVNDRARGVGKQELRTFPPSWLDRFAD